MWSFIIGTTYISTLIFAIISDAKLGRARTIITGNLMKKRPHNCFSQTQFLHVGFVLYLIGYGLITTIATGKTPLCNFDEGNSSIAYPMNITTCAGWIQGSVIFT